MQWKKNLSLTILTSDRGAGKASMSPGPNLVKVKSNKAYNVPSPMQIFKDSNCHSRDLQKIGS